MFDPAPTIDSTGIEALDAFQNARQLIESAERIAIIAHRNPDADAVGAALALKEALEAKGKHISTCCIDPIPESCQFLNGAGSFSLELPLNEVDLVISVDCGSHKLLGFHEQYPILLDRKHIPLINIDHHPSNDHFGSVNIVMDNTPATCFILFLLFTSYGWTISPSMATALLHGLYYDTGSFMHSNTSAETLRIAARLKALGGDHMRCVKEQFHTTSLQKLRLWGKALSRARLNENEAVVAAVREEDFTNTETELEDLSGLINYLNHVPEAKFSMLLTEDLKGNIKGSLRTQREDVNLSEIAGLFGGGGHKKAAGFTIPGHLRKKTIWTIQ